MRVLENHTNFISIDTFLHTQFHSVFCRPNKMIEELEIGMGHICNPTLSFESVFENFRLRPRTSPFSRWSGLSSISPFGRKQSFSKHYIRSIPKFESKKSYKL